MALINPKYRNSIWVNILIMLAIAVIAYIVLFSSLGKITNHGEQMKIPVLVDKPFEEAVKMLNKYDFEIDVDSTYDLKKPKGVVLSQMPDTGTFVKAGRTVFITVNKQEAPLTQVPDLSGVSYRSADMLLRSSKLVLADTVHRPDIADGAILEMLHKGQVIAPGMMLPQGSKITLVIGDGVGNIEFVVPHVKGLTYPEGIAMLNALGLQFIDLWEGKITDSMSAIIYYQFPEAKNEFGGMNKIKEGESIDIRIRQSAGDDAKAKGNKKRTKPVSSSSNDDNSGDW